MTIRSRDRIGHKQSVWMSFFLCTTMVFAVFCKASPAPGQSFGLDDNPLLGAGGFGQGAEDPFGFVPGAGMAPSPSLFPFLLDGDILSPGPVLQKATPNGAFIDSLSRNHVPSNRPIQLEFSVDRITPGALGTAVAGQFLMGQAPGDIYTTTDSYAPPGLFVGGLGSVLGSYAGVLPAALGGAAGNVLTWDEGLGPPAGFGLTTPAGVVGSGVAVIPPIPGTPGTHDNVDSWDNGVFDGNGDGLMDVDSYFTVYPDEAVVVGTSAADIFAVPAGTPGTVPVPYAPSFTMGLDFFGAPDSIDALVVYDNNNLPGGPGGIEPFVDYALFSLAPGSAALTVLATAGFPVDPQDIFFTDFSGFFATYAPAPTMGLAFAPGGGFPFQTFNVDGLDVIPEPATSWLMGMGLLGLGLRRQRR